MYAPLVLLLLPSAVGAVPLAWDPLPFRPKIGRCVPVEVADESPTASGRGNRPADRMLTLDFGTYRSDHFPESVGAPEALVEDIEVCLLDTAGGVECQSIAVGGICSNSPEGDFPTGCGWDANSLTAALTPVAGGPGHADRSAPVTTRVYKPTDPPTLLDWMNDDVEVVFLRVRMSPTSGIPDDSVETALRFGGFCVVPTVVATKGDVDDPVDFPPRGQGQPAGPGFVLIGQVPGESNPLAPYGFSAAELCLAGSQAGYTTWGRDTGDPDGDGLLDHDEGLGDTDGDGLADMYDGDDDGDGVATRNELQHFPGTQPQLVDILGDGVPLHLRIDLAFDNTVNDADGSGVNDSAEVGLPEDCDGDGIPNALELTVLASNPYGKDTDGDTIPDGVEAVGLLEGVRDLDQDGIPDVRDADDDGDGVETAWEVFGTGSRNPDGSYHAASADGDLLWDYMQSDDGSEAAPRAPEPLERKYSSCVSRRAAAFALESAALLAKWQHDVVMAGNDPLRRDQVRLRTNGLTACAGDPCPIHISVFPRTGGLKGGRGFVRLNPAPWNSLDFRPRGTPANHWATGNAANKVTGDLGHEFFHTFQGAWAQLDERDHLDIEESFFTRLNEWFEPTATWAPFACLPADDFAAGVAAIDSSAAEDVVNQRLDPGHPDVVASLEEWTSVPVELRTPGNRCVSRYKMHDENASAVDPERTNWSGGGDSKLLFQYVANLTEVGPFTTQRYAGSPFWRYVVEQWARGQDDPRFPRDRDGSARPSPGRHTPLGDLGRFSDEGVDLLGLVLDAFYDAQAAAGPHATMGDIFPVLDALFLERTGRGLSHLFADYHTALVLKEYVELRTEPAPGGGVRASREFINARWRIDWTGDFGEANLIPSDDGTAHDRGWSLTGLRGRPATSRPLTVAADLIGPDTRGTERPRRRVDSWDPGPAAATPRVLAVGGSVGEQVPVVLERGGFSVMSVRPSPGYGDLRVRVQSHANPKAIVRIFTVLDGVPAIHGNCASRSNPRGMLGVTPEGCRFANGDVVSEVVSVPADANTGLAGDPVFEVVLIVSGADGPGLFTWSMGPAGAGPQLVIVSPTSSSLVDAGSFDPAGPDERRDVLTQIRSFDADGSAAGPLLGDLTLCIGEDLTDPNTDGTPLTLPGALGEGDFEFPRGEFWNAVPIPRPIYALANDLSPRVRLDLRALWHPGCFAAGEAAPPHPCRVSEYPAGCEPRVATSVDSVMIRDPDAAAPPTDTMLVLDQTVQNNDGYFEDIQAAIPVLLASLGDSDYVGATLYGSNAHTVVAPIGAGPGNPNPFVVGRDFLAGEIDDALPLDELPAIGDGMVNGQYLLLQQWPTAEAGLCTNACLDTDIRQRMLVVAAHENGANLTTRAYIVKDGNDDLIDPGPPHNWPADDVELNYVARRENGTTVPIIDTISLGPDGAVADMQRAAHVGGGQFMYLDEAGFQPVPGVLPRSAQLAARFREAVDRANDFETPFEQATWGFGPGYLPWFAVENGAHEMRFLLFAGQAGSRLDETALLGPSGEPVFPTRAGEHWSLFTVDAPDPGMWQATWLGDPDVPPTDQPVYAAMSERHPVTLRVDVAALHSDGTDGGSVGGDQRAGDFIVVRATMGEAGQTGYPMIAVDIGRPDGNFDALYLSDGGYGDDPTAGDGVFQGVYRNTSAPGTYSFFARAMMFSPEWGMLQRKRMASMHLPAGVDADSDLLPDWWESWRGTQATQADATTDPDGDGLSNLQEYQAGTHPGQDDTDGGGETDGSEVAMWRNPNQAADDGASAARMQACSGSDAIHLRFAGVSTADRVLIERRLGTGSIETIHDGGLPPDGELVDSPALGSTACYRSRLRTPTWWSDTTATWSPWQCAIAASDPVAPVLEVDIEGGSISPSRYVDVAVNASDVPKDIVGSECRPHLLATEPSGVATMAILPSPDTSNLPTTTWVPFEDRATIRLDGLVPSAHEPTKEVGTAWVAVRDLSGNVSDAMQVAVLRPDRSTLDRAVRSLDDLLDAAGTESSAQLTSALATCEAELQVAIDDLSAVEDSGEGADRLQSVLDRLGGLNAAAQQEDWVAVATAADQARRSAVRIWGEFDVLLADAF
jgi:hypothetical protein